MRRRLDIAMSLIGRPSVLFLDEPTTGLDPRSRNAMWDHIDELTASGMTTLLTTQYLDEADRLADEIAVMDHGEVIARGTSVELKRRVGGERIEVAVARPTDARRAVDALASFACSDSHVEADGRKVIVPVRDVHGLVPQAVRRLDDAHIDVDDVGVHEATLDDVFFALTGHAVQEEEEQVPAERRSA
jgi:ABC-2 type transport system ATP-binding protein